MCGFVLSFSYNGNFTEGELDEARLACDSMYSRGPDSSGELFLKEQKVFMGHRRLAIIDTGNSGRQPMSDSSGRLHLVFNGEIYNYKHLRRDLEKDGYIFRTSSDTEVILNLYLQKGEDMVRYLRGMFSFALWDNDKGGVLLVRDPMGIKPLYYSDDGCTLRVASQVKALLKFKRINAREEPAGYVGFCLWGYVPEPYTLYKGIRSLSSGSVMWLDSRGIKREKKYFSIVNEFSDENISATQEEILNCKDVLRSALSESVKYHLVSDVPVGVFLSSGLDSATILALASETSADLQSVTLGFDEYRKTENDEVPLASKISAAYSVPHNAVRVKGEEFGEDFELFLGSMDQPTIDGINTYFVSKAAASLDLKVALSGVGGDELFAGYPSFTQIPSLVNGLGWAESVPDLGRGFRWVSSKLLKYFTSPKYASLLEYGGSYGGAYMLRRGMFMPWELPDILGSDVVKDGWGDLQTLSCLDESIKGINSSRLKVSSLELNWYMKCQLLRDADWAGMAHSVEIRTPLVDAWLVRKLIPLLASQNPPTKKDMALTPLKALPPEVLNRKKTGFTVPVRDWLMGDKQYVKARGLRGWALQLLNQNN
ncbi:asparagine synthase (glutamine-hydrolyzing) [Maricurvus nonylphenolicus]|uniref:asparagine synthase (glutamine-hydrolyzing) n=1 Tax=Maricurvus nonylphenolicus TaxID=1008307 RepID=UPI0036F2DED3